MKKSSRAKVLPWRSSLSCIGSDVCWGKPSQYQVTANDSKNTIISGDQSLLDYVSHAKVKQKWKEAGGAPRWRLAHRIHHDGAAARLCCHQTQNHPALSAVGANLWPQPRENWIRASEGELCLRVLPLMEPLWDSWPSAPPFGRVSGVRPGGFLTVFTLKIFHVSILLQWNKTGNILDFLPLHD